MAILFIMVGISGSGKSTVAKKIAEQLNEQGIDVVTVSTDEIRGELCGDPRDQSQNKLVFETAHNRVDLHLGVGRSVIFDATSLAKDDRKKPISIGRVHGAKIVAVVLNTPLTVAIERNQHRERVVPGPVIWRQQGRFHSPDRNEVDEIIQIGLDNPSPIYKHAPAAKAK